MNQIRVMRNPLPDSATPWLVLCGLCYGGSELFGAFAAYISGPKWWAPNWRLAQDFAARHANAHEATRCTTCLHLPARQLSPEETTR